MQITRSMVTTISASLNSVKACGPYGICLIVLKKCALELAPVLSKINNKYIGASCFPACWKSTSVVLVLRTQMSHENLPTYRLISFFPLLEKILKGLINNDLDNHLTSQGLNSDKQHDFRFFRSTAEVPR